MKKLLAQSDHQRTNQLLAALDPEDRTAFLAGSKVVPLRLGRRLFQSDAAVDAVYFPIDSMISLLVGGTETQPLELATIGNEGVVGAAEVLHMQGAIGLHLVQIAGNAHRIDAAAFRAHVSHNSSIDILMQRHFYALTRQILQGAACNRRHSMEERCARWLLQTHDRAGQDTFPLTQEFMSRMLGVRRATVNVAVGMLKKAGFIHHGRGVITVLERPGLESAACECYQTIVNQYRLLLPNGNHS